MAYDRPFLIDLIMANPLPKESSSEGKIVIYFEQYYLNAFTNVLKVQVIL